MTREEKYLLEKIIKKLDDLADDFIVTDDYWEGFRAGLVQASSIVEEIKEMENNK